MFNRLPRSAQRVGGFVLVSFALFCAGCGSRDPALGSGSTKPLAESKTWSPDPAFLEKLAPAQDVAGYRVRPPQGYVLEKRQQGGTQGFIWQGQPRTDQSTPKLWVMVGKLAPGEEKLSLEQTAAVIVGSAKQKLEGTSESPAERGQINSLTFLRLTFQGTEKGPLPFKGHAIVYHAHDGQQYIHMMAMDSEPHQVETLPLLEAAARTLQRP